MAITHLEDADFRRVSVDLVDLTDAFEQDRQDCDFAIAGGVLDLSQHEAFVVATDLF